MRAVLTYHSIDDSGSPISVSPERFREHCRWLTSGRVKTVSLDDIHAQPRDAPDSVAVTFDDGFVNICEGVERLLGEGVPVTVFVVSGHTGGTNAWGGRDQPGIPTLPLLSWDDLERLLARGVRLGAHTRTHPRLTDVSGDRLDAELGGATDDLHRRLGLKPTHLAYPYGAFNREVVTRAAQFFTSGYTTRFDVLRPSDRVLERPRLDAYYFRGTHGFSDWGSRLFTYRLATVKARRLVRGALERAVGR